MASSPPSSARPISVKPITPSSPPPSAKSPPSEHGSSTDSQASSELPCASYDGSHLHWRSYRDYVLEPHRIQVLDSVPGEHIPDALLALIEISVNNTSRFDQQKSAFRDQVAAGRGFGPSPLFPPHLLPPISKDPGLARCMLPTFSREPLPSRVSNHVGPLYELAVPHSILGMGFSASAFTPEELQCVPSFLASTGTTINYETGNVSGGAAVFCPFLTFERAHGVKESRLETANNRCAVGGAWCVRALQMLHSTAATGNEPMALPISFSCTIDNTFAIINLHWTDHDQVYYMSPLCKFDLNNDDHFAKFVVWIEAIGSWAIQEVLPGVRQSVQKLLAKRATPLALPQDNTVYLTLNSTKSPAELILRSLKTNFDEVPWRYDEEDCTPVCSSTASWGSPTTADARFFFPVTPLDETITGKKPSPPQLRTAAASAGSANSNGSTATLTIPRSPMPSAINTAQNPSPNLTLVRRLTHAMNEIQDIYTQLHVLKTNFHNATNSTQAELGAVKLTLASVLRKENLNTRNRSLSLSNFNNATSTNNLTNTTEVWSNGQAHVIPPSPGFLPNQHDCHCEYPKRPALSPRSAGLGIARPDAPDPTFNLRKRHISTPSQRPWPLTLKKSRTSPAVLFSPSTVGSSSASNSANNSAANSAATSASSATSALPSDPSPKPPNAPTIPSLPTPEPSPTISTAGIMPKTPYRVPPTPYRLPPTPYAAIPPTPYAIVPPPPPSPPIKYKDGKGPEADTSEVVSTTTLLKIGAFALPLHLAATLIPQTVLRIAVLGIITEVAMMGVLGSSARLGVFGRG